MKNLATSRTYYWTVPVSQNFDAISLFQNYTQLYSTLKIDLNNLLHFLALRADAHAQYEIRVYADIILDIVKKWVPVTYEAFEDYRVGGTQLSAKEILILKKIIKGENVDPEAEGISKREWGELQKKFDL